MSDADASPFLLRGKGLAYAYERGLAPVFSGVSFTVKSGEIMGLGGVNGSGKSSLLAVVAGLARQDQGAFFLGPEGAEAGADLRRKEACLLMQDANMQIFGATVGEDLLLTRTDPTPGEMEAAKTLAARLGLLKLWDSSPDRLSYGQKRKLCLASALLEKPRLVLLDEPFSGLDYPAAREMLAILKELKQEGLAVIISAHDFTDVFPLLTSILLMPGEGAHEPFFGPASEAARRFDQYGLRPLADNRQTACPAY